MKSTFTPRLLILGILLILFTVSCIPAIGQIEVIDFDMTIKVDKKTKLNEQYHLQILNLTTGNIDHILVDNRFILKLEYNTNYQLSISGMNTNCKVVYIDTNAPIDNWKIISGFELNTDTLNKVIAGGIRYNSKTKTFEKYKL